MKRGGRADYILECNAFFECFCIGLRSPSVIFVCPFIFALGFLNTIIVKCPNTNVIVNIGP